MILCEDEKFKLFCIFTQSLLERVSEGRERFWEKYPKGEMGCK